MKRLSTTLLPLGVLLFTAAGCGGSGTPPPPLVLSCKIRILPSGAIRAAVTVKSNEAHATGAILYGPALRLVTHEYPLLSPRFVVDKNGGGQTTYIGLVVPRIKANGSAHLLLRFTRPAQPRSIFVTDKPRVARASSGSGVCVIKGR